MNQYKQHEGYKRVENYISIILDDDQGATPAWASGALDDVTAFERVVANVREFIRQERREDPWRGLSARRRWVEAALREALERLASQEPSTPTLAQKSNRC